MDSIVYYIHSLIDNLFYCPILLNLVWLLLFPLIDLIYTFAFYTLFYSVIIIMGVQKQSSFIDIQE